MSRSGVVSVLRESGVPLGVKRVHSPSYDQRAIIQRMHKRFPSVLVPDGKIEPLTHRLMKLPPLELSEVSSLISDVGEFSSSEDIVYATVYYGSRYGAYAEVWRKSFCRVGLSGCVLPWQYPMSIHRKGQELCQKSGGYAKAVFSHVYFLSGKKHPLVLMDADSCVLKAPKIRLEKETKIAIVSSRREPQNHIEKSIVSGVGSVVPLVENICLSPFVIWTTVDLLPLWEENLPKVHYALSEKNLLACPIAMVTWNVIWQKLRKKGYAEVLPESAFRHGAFR